MVICLERCADLHMAQLMPLPLSLAHPGSPGQRAIKWVCVCVSLRKSKHDLGKYSKVLTCF